jgi:tetratricopeptide (TPR) repeat protein
VNFKPNTVIIALAVLLGVHALLGPLENRLERAGERERFNSEQWIASASHGGSIALLGGMRSMAASACWLRTNLAWERRDLAETTSLIDATVSADERPLYFWLNGARILANDIPEWRMVGPVPRSFRVVANEEQAQLALHFLEKGLRWRGPDAAFYIEMANIHLRRRGDVESAARYYRLAAEQPGAPYYAARIHGELLRELHRPVEALAWLRQILVTLPERDELAARDLVIDRIKALERELASL